MPAADGELIQRIAEKDNEAFDLLFLKYTESVYRFAFYLTRNHDESDDLFQDKWLRAVKYLVSTSKIKNFKAWIFTITANLHWDNLRKKKIRRIFCRQSSPTSEFNTDNAARLESAIEQQKNDDSATVDISLALNKAISKLSIKQRQVFMLKEIEGFKHSEIGEMLNLPVGTVKSILYRAVTKLQQQLHEYRN